MFRNSETFASETRLYKIRTSQLDVVKAILSRNLDSMLTQEPCQLCLITCLLIDRVMLCSGGHTYPLYRLNEVLTRSTEQHYIILHHEVERVILIHYDKSDVLPTYNLSVVLEDRRDGIAFHFALTYYRPNHSSSSLISSSLSLASSSSLAKVMDGDLILNWLPMSCCSFSRSISLSS